MLVQFYQVLKSIIEFQILECLRDHKKELTKKCHEQLFAREQEEQMDPGTDVVLVTLCKQMIMQYCHDVNSEKLLFCLKVCLHNV